VNLSLKGTNNIRPSVNAETKIKIMKRKAKIFYTALDDFWRKEEKLAWLRDNPIEKIAFERIEPDEKHNWINQTDNDFSSLIALFANDEQGIFNLFGNTIKTNRDDWVYDYDKKFLVEKIKYFAQEFNKHRKTNGKDINKNENNIKWSGDLVSKLQNNQSLIFDKDKIIKSSWRPFITKFFYSEKIVNDRMTDNHFRAFGTDLLNDNITINLSDANSGKPFSLLATKRIADYHFISDTKFVTLYHYDSENQKHENITDWGLTQFQTHYGMSANAEARTSVRAHDAENNQSEAKKNTLTDVRVSAPENGARITKQDIFYYTYAVLHSPVYRRKYEQNLKREFPRLPFYADFFQWANWGKQLMDLHVNYETVEPYALERNDLDLTPKRKNKTPNLFEDCPQQKIVTSKPSADYSQQETVTSNLSADCPKDKDSITSGANPTTEANNGAVPEGDESSTLDSSLSAKENSSIAPDGLHPSLLDTSASPTKTNDKPDWMQSSSSVSSASPTKELFVAKPQTKLRADKTNGTIAIDSITTLSGVPPLAWEYKLGNRSALEWILDQYKEKTPQDATIREHFNHYKFADYKEHVIDLLMRVANVSVKTMEIVNQMPNAD
jgi:predicted helicase